MTGTTPPGGDMGDDPNDEAEEARKARATAAARARRMGSRPRPGPRPAADDVDLADEPPEAPEPEDAPARTPRTRSRRRKATPPVAAAPTDDAESAADEADAESELKATPAPAKSKPTPTKPTKTAAAAPPTKPAAAKSAATKSTSAKATGTTARPRAGAGARARGKTRVGATPASTGSAKSARRERSNRFLSFRRWAGVLVTAVLVAILAAVAGVLLATRPDRAASSKDRTALLSSVKSSTALILSYDYRKLPANIDAASPHLTGDYKGQYLQAMAKTVTPKAKAQKAVVTGQVDGAGVETVNKKGTLATVLVLGELNYTSTTVTQGRTDVFRIRVTAQLVKGTWLISKIDTL